MKIANGRGGAEPDRFAARERRMIAELLLVEDEMAGVAPLLRAPFVRAADGDDSHPPRRAVHFIPESPVPRVINCDTDG